MPRMEKERNSIVGIFRSWFVSAECPRRQKEDVIGIGVDSTGSAGYTRGEARGFRLNRASRYLLMAMTVYTSGCTRPETGSMMAQLCSSTRVNIQGSDPSEVWCEKHMAKRMPELLPGVRHGASQSIHCTFDRGDSSLPGGMVLAVDNTTVVGDWLLSIEMPGDALRFSFVGVARPAAARRLALSGRFSSVAARVSGAL